MPQYNTKMPLWAPYVETFETKGKNIRIKYKGGEVECDPSKLLSIMIYGDAPPLDPSVLEFLARRKVPVIIHRRNLTNTLWITGSNRADKNDLISCQVRKRDDMRAKKYIARQLLKGKFNDMSWLLPPPCVKIAKELTIKELRNREAIHSKLYWAAYFQKLGNAAWTRRSNNPVSNALNAASKFLCGVLLRWIHYHHLSPFHGFLHEMTDYPSLVFDLIEPYRSLIDKTVFELYAEEKDESSLLSKSIEIIKEKMREEIFCPQTKQIASRQELLHGIVLSLRSYMLGETRRFSIPVAGKMNGGRPQKNPWRLYGRQAGITRIYPSSNEET